jgi:dihydrodipicolinate synthase/N-acetylneuraminate lyase
MLGLIPTDTVRPPLAPLTEANRKKMESILRECGLSVAAAA